MADADPEKPARQAFDPPALPPEAAPAPAESTDRSNRDGPRNNLIVWEVAIRQPGTFHPDAFAQEVNMSHQSLINAAKSVVLAYSDKNWNALWSSVVPDIVYEEVSTRRSMRGIRNFMSCMQEWASAFPDSKAAIRNAFVVGDHVFLEIAWHGTHAGPLESPGGTIYPTGKKVDVPACMVIEVLEDKAKMITHYFDLAALMKQIELTPEERIA